MKTKKWLQLTIIFTDDTFDKYAVVDKCYKSLKRFYLLSSFNSLRKQSFKKYEFINNRLNIKIFEKDSIFTSSFQFLFI
uniref:hypothetical protein n=1 Tax=Aliarcobacter sp. TaxID=2321116 RepID=UPI0040483805